ncbi:transporter substrate-binding domain-containing protein [Pseudodesulfovibrio sp. zrk46]|uniref:substrate-binding periplasmic protein n=1 Tax=Pseudodesulfovibrio sp. zrk46 TaxID=2725288 RepID=UPI001B385446|nr:transporter substrate-binding domain-containing protein [Pseudodesulfovibrio sp. zrk46]
MEVRDKFRLIDGFRLLCLSIAVVFFMIGGVNAAEFTVYVGRVAPFTMVAHNGEVTGAAVDLMVNVMQMAGRPIDRSQVKNISWARAVYEVEHTPDSMVFCMARTPQREDKYKWVGPIAELNLGLLGKKEPRIEITNNSEVAAYRIGVVRNSGPMQILEDVYEIPHSKLTLLPSDTAQFKMLAQGRVDLITQADTAAPDWLAKLNMDQSDYEMVHVMKKLQLYAAFNKETDDAFINKAQAALDAIKADCGAKKKPCALQKYLKDGPIPLQQPR